MKPAAVFIRHSEVPGNRPGQKIIKGTEDFPLDRTGKEESKVLATRIARYKPTVVLTSPLQRAKHPAELIGKKAGVPVHEMPELMPWDFGTMTGEKASTGEPKLAAMAKESPDKPVGGAESFNQFLSKSDQAYRKIKMLIAAGERPAVVTHSRNLREIGHGLFGTAPQDPTKGGPEPSGHYTLSRSMKLRLHAPAKGQTGETA